MTIYEQESLGSVGIIVYGLLPKIVYRSRYLLYLFHIADRPINLQVLFTPEWVFTKRVQKISNLGKRIRKIYTHISIILCIFACDVCNH